MWTVVCNKWCGHDQGISDVAMAKAQGSSEVATVQGTSELVTANAQGSSEVAMAINTS